MESGWGSLLLLFLISEGALLHVKLETIKGIIKTVSIFTCAFHGVVSQQIQPEITPWKTTSFRIVDGYV